MTTIENFVGALLEELEKARVLSDQASLRIAHLYLENEYLRGFPIPRMQVSDIEVELAFAVACGRGTVSLSRDEERRHLAYRIRETVAGFAAHPGFAEYFGADAHLAERWAEGTEALAARLLSTLESRSDQRKDLVESVALVVQAYFHEMAPPRLRAGVTAFLSGPLEKRTGRRGAAPTTRAVYIEDQITLCLKEREAREPAAEGAPLQLLLGANELEVVRPESLSKLKLTVSPADRHWVISEKDGKKIATLGR